MLQRTPYPHRSLNFILLVSSCTFPLFLFGMMRPNKTKQSEWGLGGGIWFTSLKARAFVPSFGQCWSSLCRIVAYFEPLWQTPDSPDELILSQMLSPTSGVLLIWNPSFIHSVHSNLVLLILTPHFPWLYPSSSAVESTNTIHLWGVQPTPVQLSELSQISHMVRVWTGQGKIKIWISLFQDLLQYQSLLNTSSKQIWLLGTSHSKLQLSLLIYTAQ